VIPPPPPPPFSERAFPKSFFITRWATEHLLGVSFSFFCEVPPFFPFQELTKQSAGLLLVLYFLSYPVVPSPTCAFCYPTPTKQAVGVELLRTKFPPRGGGCWPPFPPILWFRLNLRLFFFFSFFFFFLCKWHF